MVEREFAIEESEEKGEEEAGEGEGSYAGLMVWVWWWWRSRNITGIFHLILHFSHSGWRQGHD